ncbi:redoxin family protein [Amphritea pacifica]|uniref:Redoxin domain-containing protein n=1 Tax=Amphritea pacifica TaxID=2811233 RepID=A0ABS2WDA3_9GAMM|nr:redoxin family protein [Amphritea pacifica]MBN0989684.1 redoxin domain-containing protein [Amphritea pacifica]MBN1009005.1 redoxin domain-containing protein [Amphritea pacifica]
MSGIGRTFLLLLVSLSVSFSVYAGKLDTPLPAPEFSQTDVDSWFNSPPLSLKSLRGKVVMLDFWTFDCWNCYRSFPWIHELEQTLADEAFTVIGIHTPEFPHERVRANVKAKIDEFELHHPVMMDNNFTYWQMMGNKFWPTFYLIDKQGRVRSIYIGETHAGSTQARAIEGDIRELLHE